MFEPRNLLERFIADHEDWEERLSAAPYCITVRHSGDYAILKYQQLNSDFSEPLVQLCRGVIIFVPEKRIVCMPFVKFFNYGEEYAHDIDWKTASVTEKVDGSLMKMNFHAGAWHLSTNGTIDAFGAVAGETEESFGHLFERVLGMDIQTFGNSHLSREFCYMFELTSPENRVVIEYADSAIWFLAQRNMETLEEVRPDAGCIEGTNIRMPKRYDLRSLDDCISAVGEFDKSHEGIVVCDADFNRIKIKSPEYLAMAHAANNGKITTRRLVSMIRNETIDDFLAMFPQHKDRVDEILRTVRAHEERLSAAWEGTRNRAIIEGFQARFQWYKYCTETFGRECADFVMKMKDGKVREPYEYVRGLSQAAFLKIVNKKNEG